MGHRLLEGSLTHLNGRVSVVARDGLDLHREGIVRSGRGMWQGGSLAWSLKNWRFGLEYNGDLF